MTRIVIKKLIWDTANTEHIKKHNVGWEEVEVVSRNIITHRKAKVGRYFIFGRVGTRILTIVINRKGTGIYYPVTARDAAKKERKDVYEKEKKV
ncbi:MAG: hypothetical protein Q7R43_00225 [Candidatus Daviesbacteria bacterium]|nr:hypothetical protein [Candidatus Daviesbacteria bacterium]